MYGLSKTVYVHDIMVKEINRECILVSCAEQCLTSANYICLRKKLCTAFASAYSKTAEGGHESNLLTDYFLQ